VLNPTTKAYIDTLIATGASGRLDEGLVLLWAMEKVPASLVGRSLLARRC
jgi:hypothetical protein